MLLIETTVLTEKNITYKISKDTLNLKNGCMLSSVCSESGQRILFNALDKTIELMQNDFRNYLGMVYDSIGELVSEIINETHTGTVLNFILHKEGNLIGLIYMYDIAVKCNYKRLTLAYGILPEYTNKGLASSVLNEVVDLLQEDNWARIELAIEPINIASLNLINKKLNSKFFYEGIRKNFHGIGNDVLIYAACK